MVTTRKAQMSTGSKRLALLFIVSVLMLTGCASYDTTLENEAKPETAEESTVTESPTPTPMSDTEDESTVSQHDKDSAWATALFDEAMQKAGQEWGFTFLTGENSPFENGFDNVHDRVPLFENADAYMNLVDTPIVVDEGKVIIASWSSESVTLVKKYTKTTPSPLYYCYRSDGVDPARFADSLDECDFFIVYGGFVTSIDEEYYHGGADRTSVTTLVFVIDAEQKKLLHIESIGTDVPGTTTDHTFGDTLTDDAFVYINSIIA